jgi:L-asparaginase II
VTQLVGRVRLEPAIIQVICLSFVSIRTGTVRAVCLISALMRNLKPSETQVKHDPAARVYRGTTVEALHYADVAVVNAEGKLTHFCGDPGAVYMTRSSIKPFQALPLILTGGFDHFKFERRHLAIMCSSHSGTDEHVAVVEEALARAGNTPDDLQCGSGWPLYFQFEGMRPPVTDNLFGPLRSDCSGKHAGFLALARYLGEPISDYLNPDSPAQQLVRQSVADVCQHFVDQIAVGIDGCSAPNFSMPLINLAVGFKNLALAQSPDKAKRQALKRVFEAMTGDPYLVAGHKRFCYDFMRAFPDNGVTKLGAEAIQGVGFVNPPLGIAVKVRDGAVRALGPVCLQVLKQLGLIDIGSSPLAPYETPEIRNARNLVTGRMVVDFQLVKA